MNFGHDQVELRELPFVRRYCLVPDPIVARERKEIIARIDRRVDAGSDYFSCSLTALMIGVIKNLITFFDTLLSFT